MKFLLQTLLIILLGFGAGYFLDWWTMAPVAALVSLFFVYKRAGWSFLSGLVGGYILWLGFALYLNTFNGGFLATKMGILFGGLSANGLLLATGLTGGLLAAFGALTGGLARTLGKSESAN